jgi:putative N6-adenine-specific DNA methylase
VPSQAFFGAFFATCPRGLEALLAEELRGIGASAIRAVPGGVGFEGDLAACYGANLKSRIATRVLLQLGRAPYRQEQDVYAAAHDIPWHRWFAVERSIRVDVTAIRSPLKSLDFITLRIKDAVCDRFRAERGSRPDVDTRSPDVRVAAFLDAHNVTLYLDTSGEPLYKRGYRTERGEAPLKENLAAGILALTGWDHQEPLFDPMCGSGTFLIEAAMMALQIAPGAGRSFGFERLLAYDAKLWRGLRDEATAAQEKLRALPVFGSDVSGRELRYAHENLKAAGLDQAVELRKADVLEVPPPAPYGVMVVNPPYGVRLVGEQAMTDFYPKLGDALKNRYTGWRCYIFSADTELPRRIRLKATKRTPLFNGPLECRLYEYRVIAGSLRRPRDEGPAAG